MFGPMMHRTALLLAATLTLSGCGKAFYEYGAEALRNPKVREAALQDCIKDTERKSLFERQAIADATRTSLARAPQVFCRRIVVAVASGRISYADLQNEKGDEILRVMAGR